MKVRFLAILAVTLIALAAAVPAFATPSPPSGAGNGAGQSAQCTGPAADRPAVCPGS
jgi:hypothetical protein